MITINTALTSYGMSGLVFHGPLLEAHPGFNVTKILERNKSNSLDKHPGSELVRDYDSILNDSDIELIIVNTPDYLHYEMSMQALDAGKHIVVEKPFTLKSEEANRIIELGKKKGLMVSVFHNRRWDGDSLTVRKIIKEGKLGRLVSYESHFDRFRNFIQSSWKEESSLGAGTLYNLGSHMIDEALNIFGMPEYLFADVRGMRTNSKVDDSFDIILHYPDVKCFVRGSYLVKEPGPRYILHGTEGSFLKFGSDPQEAMLKAGVKPTTPGWGADQAEHYGTLNTGIGGTEIRTRIPSVHGNYMSYYDNIYDHLQHGTSLAVPGEEGRDVITIIEAAYKSAEKGEVVRIGH